MDNLGDNIVPLDQLKDFEIADGDPDIRGWTVLGADGRKIGEVDNLLVDVGVMKVRYLDVDIDDELLIDGENRHILVPVGYARLDEDDDQIFVDGLHADRLGDVPIYSNGPVTIEYENDLRGYYDRLERRESHPDEGINYMI